MRDPQSELNPLLTAIEADAAELDAEPAALRAAFDALGPPGLLGCKAPVALGGLGMDRAAYLDHQERLAAASGALAFLAAQHQSAVALLCLAPDTAVAQRWLGPLITGGARAAIAFAHLRRPQPPLRATPAPGGYRLTGDAPWVTGWALLERCLTAAVLPDGAVLFALHPLETAPGLAASPPMRLVAFNASNTVSLRFSDYEVREAQVLGVFSPGWIRQRDEESVTAQGALILGTARAALQQLADASSAEAQDRAGVLAAEHALVRAALVAGLGSGLQAACQARAAAIQLAGRAAQAAVLAAGGSAATQHHPAGRIWREALVFTVLALTEPVRKAALRPEG